MILREIDKIFRKNMGFVFFAAAILIRLITLGVEEHAVNAYTVNNREAYLSIVTPFSGKITDQAAAGIEKVYQAVANAQVDLDDLRQDYLDGEISREDYLERSRPLEVLYNNDDLFLTFYSQFIYAQEAPEQRYLLYEDGWNALLTQERLDWGFVLLTILFSASIFGREYESNMRTLLIATQKGDERLAIAKFLAVFIVIGLCSLLSSAIEYGYFDLKYGLPHGDYPLQSLRYFKDSAFHLTLRQTFLYISAYRMLGYLLLSVLTMFISVLSGKTIITLAVSLMVIVLPYALPITASTKYLLPSPLGFILAQGFFRSTEMSEFYQSKEVLFAAISPEGQTALVLGWLVFAMVLLAIILIKFSPAASPRAKSSRKTVILPLILLVCSTLLSACNMPTATESQQTETIFNAKFDTDFTVVDGRIVTIFPHFLMEDMESHEVEDVIRDPFSERETVDRNVSSVFSKDEFLYYIETSDSGLKIIELDLDTYLSRTIYSEEKVDAPFLFSNAELDTQGGLPYAFAPAFFLTDTHIFLFTESIVEKINRFTGAKETIIDDLRPRHLAFDGEKIYYTNEIHELFAYDISTGRKRSLGDIRAESFYLDHDRIYYSNTDENFLIYVFELSTEQSQLIVAERSTDFVCDDDYLYYINQDDQGYLYRFNLTTGISELLVPIYGHKVYVIADYPFVYYQTFDFPTGASDTYRIAKETLQFEVIEALSQSTLP